MTGYQIKVDDRYYVKVLINEFYTDEEMARKGWFSYESYKLEKIKWTTDRNKAGWVTIRNLPEKIKKLDQLKKRGFEEYEEITLIPIEV